MQDSLKQEIETKGYAILRQVLTERECLALARDFGTAPPGEPSGWRKGHIVSDDRFFRLGTSRAIVDRIGELLGKDIVLFGGVLLTRTPGAIHPWHTDMETAMPEGGTVSVWIGLENIDRETSLHVIAGSHALGLSIQQVACANALPRDQIDAATAARWSAERNPACSLEKPDMQPGDALLFDGRIWHGSHNTSNNTRLAMLLHYARADLPVREGDLSQLGWPIRYREDPKPPCILVRGGSDGRANRIEPTPSFSTEGRPRVTSRCSPLTLPFSEVPEHGKGWQVCFLHNGATAYLDEFSCHASRLKPGTRTHPPHRHDHEELVLVLDGSVDILSGRFGLRSRRISAGEYAFLPRWCFHTMKNRTGQGVTYVIFKWRAAATPGGAGGDPEFGSYAGPGTWTDIANGRGFQARGIMDRPAMHVRKLQIHRSRLQPGGGYEPHADAYDVALIVLEGEIESLGVRAKPFHVFHYAAGEPHGISNPGVVPAEYLVMEFHGDTQVPVLPSR